MASSFVFGLGLLGFLAGSYAYSRTVQHPDEKPLAAYLIFLTVFAVAGFGLFTLITTAFVLSRYRDLHPKAKLATPTVPITLVGATLTAPRPTRNPPTPPIHPQ